MRKSFLLRQRSPPARHHSKALVTPRRQYSQRLVCTGHQGPQNQGEYQNRVAEANRLRLDGPAEMRSSLKVRDMHQQTNQTHKANQREQATCLQAHYHPWLRHKHHQDSGGKRGGYGAGRNHRRSQAPASHLLQEANLDCHAPQVHQPQIRARKSTGMTHQSGQEGNPRKRRIKYQEKHSTGSGFQLLMDVRYPHMN